MQSRRSCLVLMGSMALWACSPQDKPAKIEVSMEAIASKAKGFPVGALMGRNTVYVFFDPQCPHCGHLWQSSVPLQTRVKFVWIPIKLINAASLAQGAALLSSPNPQAKMAEHEASLLGGQGGISASSSISSELEEAIKANTSLFNSFGAESVPFIVAKNAKTGDLVKREGALGTPELADFLGLDLTP